MNISSIFDFEESRIFSAYKHLWQCNCGDARYDLSDLRYKGDYSTIICQCGHPLAQYEYSIYKDKWRKVQMDEQERQKRIRERQAEGEALGLAGRAKKGKKYDTAKPRMDLLLDFSRSLNAIAELCTIGAEKYTPHGWLDVEGGEARYTAAMLRHLFTDEEVDDDTSVLHDTAVAWNALTRLELKLRRIGQARGQVKAFRVKYSTIADFRKAINTEAAPDNCCTICGDALLEDYTCPTCSGEHND